MLQECCPGVTRITKTAFDHNDLLKPDEIKTLHDLYVDLPNTKVDIEISFDLVSEKVAPIYDNCLQRHLEVNYSNRNKNKLLDVGKSDIHSKSTPLLLRQAIYCVIYVAYMVLDDKEERRYGILRKKGLTNLFFDKFNIALKKIGHKGDVNAKILLKDKWYFPILRDYCDNKLGISNNYKPYAIPKLPFNYAGHKDGYLGCLLNHLVTHAEYDIYVELFGGSGIGAMQHGQKKATNDVINEFNPFIVNFYDVIKFRFDSFISKCNKMIWSPKVT